MQVTSDLSKPGEFGGSQDLVDIVNTYLGNTEPSRACNGRKTARGAEGVTTRRCRKNNPPTSPRHPGKDEDIVWAAPREVRGAEAGHKQARDNTTDSGYEALNVSPSDVFTAAVFDWKQAAVTVSISGLEGDVQNTGPDRIIDLLESRIKNAERTMLNNISVGVYSLGTGTGGKQIGGLQLLVAQDPSSGIIGGINRTNWSFWQNKRFRCSTDGLAGDASADNIYRYMTKTYLSASRGRDQPDLVISDNNFFAAYMESLQDKQRFTDPKLADAGFQNVKFMGADVVFDGGISGDCPANSMYFLNTNYIFYRPHKDRDMVPLETRVSLNQDATVKPLVWAGNMTMSNAQLQAVMYND